MACHVSNRRNQRSEHWSLGAKLALDIHAGIGNFGVTRMQIVIPLVMTMGLFDAMGGDP